MSVNKNNTLNLSLRLIVNGTVLPLVRVVNFTHSLVHFIVCLIFRFGLVFFRYKQRYQVSVRLQMRYAAASCHRNVRLLAAGSHTSF